MTDNQVYTNTATGNGFPPPPGSTSPGDFVYAVIEEDPGGNNNCFNPGGNQVKRPLANTITSNCP